LQPVCRLQRAFGHLETSSTPTTTGSGCTRPWDTRRRRSLSTPRRRRHPAQPAGSGHEILRSKDQKQSSQEPRVRFHRCGDRTAAMNPKRRWREGKVRPVPGNSPHDRTGKPGYFPSFRRVCDDPSSPLPSSYSFRLILRRPVCVFKAGRNLSVRCGPNQNKVKTNPGAGPTASRWSARTGQKNASGGPRSSHRPR